MRLVVCEDSNALESKDAVFLVVNMSWSGSQVRSCDTDADDE